MQYNDEIYGKEILTLSDFETPLTFYGVSKSVQIYISKDIANNSKFSAIYSPWQGSVAIDLRAVITSLFDEIVPGTIGLDHTVIPLSIYLQFIVDGNDVLFSEKKYVLRHVQHDYAICTDLKYLRVPQNYLVPLCRRGGCENSGYEFQTITGQTIQKHEGLSVSESSLGTVNRFEQLPKGHTVVRTAYSNGPMKEPLTGPILQICQGNFEQYLFFNKYGGFDNIPMDGILEENVNISFTNGSYDNMPRKIFSTEKRIWKQNSGYLTRESFKVLSELLSSDHIFHLHKGEWKRIIITDCNITQKSLQSLHSISFNYRYTDNIPKNSGGYYTSSYIGVFEA